jgi:hypothetical protein
MQIMMEHGMCEPTVKWSMAFPPGLPKIRLGQTKNYAAFLSGFSDRFLSISPRTCPLPPAGFFRFSSKLARHFQPVTHLPCDDGYAPRAR